MAEVSSGELMSVLGALERLLEEERHALRVLDPALIDVATARKLELEQKLAELVPAVGAPGGEVEAALKRVREAAHENHLLVVHARSCVRAGLAAATGTAPEDYATVRPPGATQIAALKVDVRG